MARKPRQQRPRPIRRTFYVFCEGKSEKAYIEMIRQTLRPHVQLLPIVCKSNISEKEIASILARRETIAYDRMFAMYDLDVKGIFERINSLRDVTPLLSNPCLEVWYLLHFTEHKSHMDSDECVDSLKQYVKAYKKGEIHTEMLSVLSINMHTAIKRARSLHYPDNPSTSIWQLIDSLEK